MSRVYLNERFRDMPHHRRRILRVHPYVRIPLFLLFGGMLTLVLRGDPPAGCR
jgi:hypothetical protein